MATWASLSSNQCFSFTTLLDAVTNGIFTLKKSFSANSKMITRANAEEHVYVQPITASATNQLVVKSEMVAITTFRQVDYEFSNSGCSGQSFSVYKNTTILIASGTASTTGTFSVYEGDVISIYHSSSPSGGSPCNFASAEIVVSGISVASQTSTTGGATVVATWTVDSGTVIIYMYAGLVI